MKKIKKLSIALLGCVFLAAVGFSVKTAFASDRDNVVFSESEISSEYAKGSKMVIPSVTAQYKGNSYVSNAVLHKPDGSANIVSGEYTVEGVGNYELEYRVVIDKKVYTKKYSFKGYADLFQLSSTDDYTTYCATSTDLSNELNGKSNMSLEYKTSDINGQFVSLSKGEKLYVNDYFDISKADLSKPLINIAIIPKTRSEKNPDGSLTKTYDFKTINIDFISKTDSSKFLRFVGHYYLGNNCTYFLAGADNQTPSGYESYWDRVHVGDQWGSATTGSFCGYVNNRTLYQDTFQVYMNYSDKMVYGNSQKYFVIDLDNSKYFGNLWRGFDDPNVRVEISCDDYEGNEPAKLCILSVGDLDISKSRIEDSEAPEISVDYGGYSQNDLPKAVVGNPYAIFNASAYDWFAEECDVKVNVYGRYNSSQKYLVNIENGYFIPNLAEDYVIEYVAVDHSGNVATKLVTVEAINNSTPIAVELTKRLSSLKTGISAVLPDATCSGGEGDLTVKKFIVYNGERTEIEGEFRPEKSGTYTIEYVACDYNGQIKTVSYNIEVSSNSSAVFIDEIYLPKYMIEGSKYVLPEVYAYDYSSNNGVKKVKATVWVKDALGARELTGYEYTPTVNAHLDTIQIKYQAVINSALSNSKTISIPICKVGNGKNVDLSKYFIANHDVSFNKTSSYLSIETEADNTLVEFATKQLASGFSLNLDVDPEKNNFKAFNVYLREVNNENNFIKITFEKGNNSTSYMSVNDGLAYNIKASFFGGGIATFDIVYDNSLLKIASEGSDVKLDITKDMFGNIFKGFSSSLIYVSFEFVGVSGPSALRVMRVVNQNFGDLSVDLIKPKVALLDSVKTRYSIHDEVVLLPAVAVDVLDPNVTAYYSVYDPDGELVKDVNGKEVFEIDVSKTPTIKLDKNGVYTVDYYAVDWNNRALKNFSYTLEVVDEVPPVITLGEITARSAKVGDRVAIASATAIDNIDGNIDVAVFIVRPDGKYIVVKNGNYTFTASGIYTVKYYAVDESGNTVTVTYKINVEK